jgi:hypothetical protein
VRIIGLCLIAVFAVAAVAATSASAAAPEWGHCVAQKKGNYTEGNCATVAEKKGKPDHKGSFEWVPGGGAECYSMKKGNYTESGCKTVAEKKGKPDHKGSFEKTGGGNFTAKATTAGILYTNFQVCSKGGERKRVPSRTCVENGGELESTETFVECSSETGHGESVGLKGIANVGVTFEGCKALGALPCNTEGKAPEEIVTTALKGELGYINAGTHSVGALLEPAASKGLFAKFECPSISLGIEVGVGNPTEGAYYQPETTGGFDGIISPITPVNKMTPTFTQVYTTKNQFEGNIPGNFEGGHMEQLEAAGFFPFEPSEGTSWSPAGQEITNINTVEGLAEIKG